jgi:diacylglycerol kinase (ATP)
MTGARGFAGSVAAASAGVRFAWRGQPHFRFEVLAGVAAVALALWLETGLVAVLMASAVVLVAEMVNTAVEAAVDLASPERRPLAAAAKDAAAGAVLIAAGFAVLVGLLALGPALWARLTGAAVP